ncbi:glycosyl transferase family group 2-domain-containing protein [Hyaloscypha sp. PMI_1271]|nr:glycosyl transferase family group 2-domain-containing protein [Hyaloscypha sp. PMI_1271]
MPFHTAGTIGLLRYRSVISMAGITLFTYGQSNPEGNSPALTKTKPSFEFKRSSDLILLQLEQHNGRIGALSSSASALQYHRPQLQKYSASPAVARSVGEMRHLQQLDSRVKFSIVTDFPHEQLFCNIGVNVISTPPTFRPHKALYKARALEWFRIQAQLHEDDWVLHLDEETIVDEHTIEACIRFAETENSFDVGQGIILYNAYQFWSHKLITAADICRCRDDLGKFFLASSRLHVPVFGVHGSFLLVRGKVENEVGWDTDSLVEDYRFSLQAWSQGYRLGWIPSVAREQSPMTLSDFFKQRRRWFTGMWSLPGMLGKLSCFQWCGSSFAAIFIAIGRRWGAQVPYWAYIFMTICSSTENYSLAFACVFQDLDKQIPAFRIFKHVLLSLIGGTIVNLLDVLTVVYSIFYPAKGFQIISK